MFQIESFYKQLTAFSNSALIRIKVVIYLYISACIHTFVRWYGFIFWQTIILFLQTCMV